MFKNLKPWQKVALSIGAVSITAGLCYTGYYFLYKKKKDEKEAADSGSKNSVIPNGVTPNNATPSQVKLVETAAQSGAVLTPNEQAILATQGRGGDGPVRTGGIKTGEGKGDADIAAVIAGKG